MRISAGLPTGVSAVLFETARRRRALEAQLVDLLASRDFSEVLLPVLDYFEPYESLLRENQDQLYRFIDSDGRLLSLRADFTPLLARLLAPRLGSLSLPLRLFYRGDVVRRQEAGPGRLREYSQMGAELLGAPPVDGDSEILGLFLDALAVATQGVEVKVVLGMAGALDQLLVSRGGGDAAGLAEAVSRRDRAAARAADPALLEVVVFGLPSDLSSLGEGAARRVSGLVALRDRLTELHPALSLSVDLAEFATSTLEDELHSPASRWSYYDGIVFQAYENGGGQPIGSGGRYDRLFASLGAPVKAVGFSLSPDLILHHRGRAASEDRS